MEFSYITIKNRIKYFIFNHENLWFIFLLTAFMIGTCRYSDEEIIDTFNNKLFSIIFIPDKPNNLLSNIFLAFVTSVIFYYFTITFPNLLKKTKYKKIIDQNLYQVYFEINHIFSIFKKEDYNFELYDKREYDSIDKHLFTNLDFYRSTKYRIYEQLEFEKAKLLTLVSDVLVYQNYLDEELILVLLQIKLCHMYTALPYQPYIFNNGNPCAGLNSKIYSSNFKDLYDIKSRIKKWALKNKRLEYIKIVDFDLDRIKDWKEYERVTKISIEEGQQTSYHILWRSFLELNNFQKATKYLLKHIKKEETNNPINYRYSNFSQYEHEYNDIILNDEYRKLRSEFLEIENIKFYCLPLLPSDIVSRYHNYSYLVTEYEKFKKNNSNYELPKISLWHDGGI